MIVILYPTHKRGGILHGEILSIAFLISGGYSLLGLHSMTDTFMAVLLCISGCLIGSELPDCDSPQSKPSQHYPLISMIFRIFGVHHRGKFSHSILSQTLTMIALFFIAMFGLDSLQSYNVEYASIAIKLLLVFGLANVINVVSLYIYELFKSDAIKGGKFISYLMYVATDDNEYKQRINFRKPKQQISLTIHILSYIIAAFLAFIIPNTHSNLVTFLALFVLGLWFGVMSHLIMDMITQEGVWLGWSSKIQPIPLARHIPILKSIIGPGTTNSPYETRIRFVTSIICVFLFFILIIKFF